jgi:hypothetical protein
MAEVYDRVPAELGLDPRALAALHDARWSPPPRGPGAPIQAIVDRVGSADPERAHARWLGLVRSVTAIALLLGLWYIS